MASCSQHKGQLSGQLFTEMEDPLYVNSASPKDWVWRMQSGSR